MKLPSPLTLLLFIHSTSAFPLPSMFSDCWRYGTCRDALLGPRITEDAAPDQYISRGKAASINAPHTIKQVHGSVAPKDMPSLIATALRVEVMKEDMRHDILISPSEDDIRVLSWSQQVGQQAWRNSREYSELLVISIVILFLIILTAWESVCQSSKSKSTYKSRTRGPIYLSDDEDAIPFRRYLSDEKADFWKGNAGRWRNGKPCCAEHANSPIRITCDDLSTTELISKCVRGVCET